MHRVLEESFQDHFSSYRESFPEFVMRLREDPGHRWDHWWLATVETDEGVLPAGAPRVDGAARGCHGLRGQLRGLHRGAPPGSRPRGRKGVVAHRDRGCRRRGRNRVGLEVDGDSPTGADGLYTSMGWVTDYRTQSWHRELDLR